MYTWENAVLTKSGMALMSKLTSGQTLALVRAVSGSGSVSTDSLQYQSSVSDQQQELSFGAQSYPEEGKCAVTVRLFNAGLSAGYTAKQIGVFAMDPDDGEILFLIAQASSGDGTDIPSETEMPGYSAEWTLYLQYGQADGVSLTVDPANTVSEEEVRIILKEHTSNTSNPHGVTKEQIGLDQVDNTADSAKYVAYASRAGIADKAKNTLTIRFNGGHEDEVDSFQYNGALDTSVNITAEKIEALPAIEDPNTPGCYYRMVNGEKRWINPPLMLGTEYLTIEKIQQNDVYTKYVKLGKITENTSRFTFSTTATPIRFEAFIVTAAGQRFILPCFIDGVTPSVAATAYDGQIVCHCDDAALDFNFSLFARVWYVYEQG